MPTPRGNADTALRDHLLASAVDSAEMSSTLEGHRIENGETVWEHLSHKVDALLAGEEMEIARYDLPDWHPESPSTAAIPMIGSRSVLMMCCGRPSSRLGRGSCRLIEPRGGRWAGAATD